MDGQRPPNINGNSNKNIVPGGNAAGNVFLPSLFTQSQIPTTSACPPNSANLPWAKNQVFQNFFQNVDQTKNLPNMYNMFAAGNMATNGSFGSNLDNSWQNSSSSQSNLANNPLLAAFASSQQQSLNYSNKNTNNVSSAPLNPLLGSSHLRQPSTSFDPLSIHPTPSALNPPISQPKQPPKHPTDSLFSSVPSSSSYGSSLPSTSSDHSPFNFPPGYDQLRDQLSALSGGGLGQQLHFPQPQQQQQQRGQQAQQSSSSFSPAPLARPQPRSAGSGHGNMSQQPFDLLSAAVKNNDMSKPASGFDLSQIFPSTSSMGSMLSPPMSMRPNNQMPPSIVPTIFPSQHQTASSSINFPQNPSQSSPSIPSIFPPQQQMPSTSGMVHQHDDMSKSDGGFDLSQSSGLMMDMHQAGPSSSSMPPLQIPSTSSLSVPTAPDGTLISPRAKRRSGGQNGGDLNPEDDGLDLDLDDFNIFDGITQRDQEGLLNSSLNFDELFSDPTVFSTVDDPPPPPPKLIVIEPPPKVEEPKKEEVSSASSKMQRLMAQLKNSRGAAPPPAPTPAPQTTTPIPSTTPVDVCTPPVVFQKPATPNDNSDRLTFTPPLSPVDLSDPSKPSTSGISSLIAASILPEELLMGRGDSSDKKKTIPVYLRDQSNQPSTSVPAYRDRSFVESKDDEFAFTDEDPEENGEKLKGFNDDESEEEDEQSRDAKAGGADKDTGMKYVTRIGFEDKKEGGEKESASTMPKKENKKPVPIFPGRERHARQESLEFAERLRKRRKDIVKIDFASIQQCEHNQCAIDSVQKNVEDADKPPLPRLLIRLPKKSIGGEKESRRKKKKRHYYDEGEEGEGTDEDSDDWYGGRPKKRRGRKPKRELHPDETYSVRLVDPSTIEHARKEVHVRPMEYMSKKEKLMRSWRQDNAGQEEPPATTGRGVEGKLEPKSLTKIVTEYKNADARDRLEKFKHCSGFTPRGTFLVLKAEINTPDCALWRVDNMNLLQKFPGFLGKTQPKGPLKLLYKNSSTYSGWCEQLQSGYMVVEVKHVKNTRSETVVEPIIPVDDLFPAISEELNEKYCVPSLKALINKEDVAAQTEARNFILKDDVRNGLYMVIKNMLDGALSFDYFSKAEEPTVGALSNPSFELLNEMECQVRECEEMIKERISFQLDFELNLRRYSSCMSIECELSEIICQACAEEPVEKTLQLFDRDFDNEKEVDDDEFYYDKENLLPAVDFLVCAECCKMAMWHHRLIHFRNDLTKRIEDRLLEATLEMPSMVPDQIVDNLRQCYTWMKEMIITHTDTWDTIMKSEEEEDDAENQQKDAPVPGSMSIPFTDHVPVNGALSEQPDNVLGSLPLSAPKLPPAYLTGELEEDDDDLIDPVTL